MLVISTHADGVTYLEAGGETVILTVVEARAGRVRLGFDAGPAVRVVRGELLSPQERRAARERVRKAREGAGGA